MTTYCIRRVGQMVKAAVLSIGLVWAVGDARAQPGNDNCATAQVVGAGATPFNNTGANTDGTSSCNPAPTAMHDVWFNFVATFSGPVAINTFGSSFDTTLSVQTDCGGFELACNDDMCGVQSCILFAVSAGTSYVIRVAGVGGAVGPGVLNIVPGGSCGCGPTNPTGEGVPTSATNCPGSSVCMCINVTPGSSPTSTGLSVIVDLSAIGGASAFFMGDDGLDCDATAGDNTFCRTVQIPTTAAPGTYFLPFTIFDAQGRSSTGTVRLTITPCPPTGTPVQPGCETFEDPSIPGWTSTAQASIQLSSSGGIPGSGQYLQVDDQPNGPSLAFSNGPFAGDWLTLACECAAKGIPARLEFDVRLFNDGDNTVSPVLPASIILYNDPDAPSSGAPPVAVAAFAATVTVNENTGWAHVVAPIPCPGASLTSPTGTWNVSQGTWATLLGNVTHIGLPIEVTSGSERWGWDNICLKGCECVQYESARTNAVDDTNSPPGTSGNDQIGLRGSSLSVVGVTPTSFTSRYASVIAANTRLLGGIFGQYATTDYDLTFTVNANPGEAWCMLVNHARRGQFTMVDDGNGSGEACLSPVSGSLITSTVSLAGGTLNLPGFFDCNAGSYYTSGGGSDQQFDQQDTALITGVGTQTVTLRFHWYGHALSRPALGDGDSVGIRMGESRSDPNNHIDTDVTTYPGDPSRTQSLDGHFVTLTCLLCVDPAKACADFNPASPPPSSTHPVAVENFSTTGAIARPLYNPGAFGSGGGAGGGVPASPDGFLRIEDVDPLPGASPIALHANDFFHGKWDCICGNLEFDMRMPKDGVGGSPACFPTLTITRNDGIPNAANNSSSSATFTSTTPITEGLTWTHVVIPFPPPATSSALGSWTLAPGSDWDHLLGHVTSVSLRGDCTAGLGVVDYDNICIKHSDDCVRPPNDLVGWWTFDEKIVPLHEIASQRVSLPQPNATGLNGPPTFVNAPKPIKGKVGGALEFDGTDDLVRVSASTPSGNASPFQVAFGNFSIDAWVKTTQGIGELPIVDKRSTIYGAPPTGYRFFLLNGRLAFSMGDAVAPGETVCLSSGPFISDGQWHHVAVTVQRGNPSPAIKLYVDCNLISQCSPGGKTGVLANLNADLLIGAGHAIGGPAAYFRGAIDELEFFRRALSQQEICDIYNARCGKCRERCSLRPYLSINGSGGVSSRICNGTATPKSYAWSIANTTGSGCTISGLTFSPSSGVVTVPAFGCVNVTSTVGLPGGMTINDLACYAFTFTDSDGAGHTCKGALRTCDVTLCWYPVGPITGIPLPLAFPAVGTGTPVTFEFTNSGAARSIPYRLEARNDDGSPAPIISLNGLPPGVPVIGTLMVSGGGATTPLSVNAAFTNFDIFSGYSIVMLLDLNGTGDFQPVDSVIVEPVWSDTPCPGEFRDNFDSAAQGSICGQNNWEQWVGSTDVCGQVSRDFAFDGSQSVKLVGNVGGSTGKGDDIVQRVSVNGGVWTFRAMTYISQSATGSGYISLLNTYDDPPGAPISTYRWSFDATFDAFSSTLSVFRAVPTMPLVRDRWAELRVDINLDTDSVDVSYDGQTFITGKSWTDGSSDNGLPRIQAIDLYAGEPNLGGISAMYVDAVSLTTTCTASDCNFNGTDDTIEMLDDASLDQNSNGVLDACESLCDSIDFNNDTSFFDPQDIDAFLSVFSEGTCIPDTATCNDIDFNNDTSFFDPCDIDSFLLQFAEGPCTPCGA